MCFIPRPQLQTPHGSARNGAMVNRAVTPVRLQGLAMRMRLSAVLFISLSILLFCLGAFLFMNLDGAPALGLVLMAVSAIGLLRQFSNHRLGARGSSTNFGDDVLNITQRARRNYQYDVEQRQRDNLD